MNEKKIFVQRGQVFKIESLEDGMTGERFLSLRDDQGRVVRTSEIRTAEGLVFTANESARTFSVEGLEYRVFCVIKEHFIEPITFIFVRDLARLLNDEQDLRIGISPNTVSKICRSLGFSFHRKAEGFGVFVQAEDLKRVELRFPNHPTE